MKSKLTLLMVALLSVCAFAATTWKASEETPVAAGSTLIDDELVTAKTVYETTLKSAVKQIAGEDFTHYIQVRVDVAPTAEEPNGTDKGGSTPIIFTAKKNLTLKIYYRRQSTSQEADHGVYASNDGKDLKIVNQTDPATVLDGTLTIIEETEDYKYAWVTKEYELEEGNTYTIWGRGTTINFYGMTYEGKEPPAPVVGEAIELNPESGDISAELAAAMENNPYPSSITINLAANGAYTVSQAIETVGNLTIQGDASAPATIDASGLTAPMVLVKSDLAAFQPNEATGFYELGNISIANVKVTGLAQQLIYGNKVKALYGKVAIDNSIVEVAGGSKTVIDFNGGGVAETVSINNSTIYANPQHTGTFYSSQSGQKATEAGLDKQTISITNSTLYNIAYAKNVNTHRQANQTFLAYELKNSVILDCGKEGQFVKGLNQGQAGKNPTWMIDGNSFLRTVEGAITDMSANEETGDEEEPVTNNVEGVAVFAGDITTGDFTFDQCPQNEARIGDPRWLVDVVVPMGEPIHLFIEPGKDIAAELAAAMETNKYPERVIISLIGGNYTISSPIVVNSSIGIGTAYLPMGEEGIYLSNIDVSALTGPMIQISDDIHPSLLADNGFYQFGDITISGVNVKGLSQQLIYGNKVKALYGKVAIDNSIVEVAGGQKTVIDFNGGGVAEMVSIKESTIYGNPQHTGQLYSSQSGQKATEAGLEKQTISIINSTLYNIAYAKNVNTHRQANQTWLAYELKNSVILDCGKEGQFVKGLNQGQAGKNPTWMIDGNSFLRTVDGAITDMSASEETGDEEEPVTNNVEGVAVFANDIATGDFTFDQCPQNEACIGDPRWLVEVKKSFEGKYYLYNVGAKKYWGCANDWGTRASLVDHPEYVTLAQITDGVYTLESQVSNGGTSYYFGGDYMDGNPVNLTITKVDDENYTIANDAGELYGYDGSSTILGKNVAAGDNALWKIISEEEMLASLNTATASAPVDATFLIIDAKFGRNNRNVDAWIVSEDCTNKNLVGGNSNKHCAESYHSTFTISQVLSNVPNGVYAFEAQGFYRQDGSDNDNLAQFFINDETAVVPLKTGAENSMADACASFENGLYKIEPLYVEVKDGQITVGIKNETNPNLWVIWDNFVLTYYGADASLDEVKNAAIIAELADLRAKATELQGQPEVAKVNEGLTNALTETAEVSASSPTEEIHAAIDKLKAAIEAAEASISAKNTLAAMKELIDNTNVYTEEAYNEYYGQWVAKYEEGTLTKTEAAGLQNPFVVTGWHSSITVDNFLLSAWDTNPDFVDAPYYINSWSVEGESDGSNFKVPFFEYWTGDDNSLGERTLTATINNLPVGVYDISALVRVRVKNGVEDAPIGITLQANDGEPVPVTNGTQIGTSQYYLDTFTAQGIVGEDGILKIKFNVTADNNISWLSFKNVNYAFNPIGDAIVLNVEDGKDIVAELATAMETNKFPESITINLAAGGNYAATSSIVANCPITINGDEANPATIDATTLAAPMLLISNELVDNLLGDNGFYQLGNIAISNVKVKGLAQQLIYGNKVKAQYGTLSLTNSIIEVAGGNKTVFDFNGGGVVETLAINNSTIYGNPQHTGQLYSSQSGQKATEAGLEKQTISITNSTLYNIAYAKNVNTHRQANQTWLAYELKNSVILDCGKEGQFVKGLNGGQSGKNPTWMIDGNSFLRTVDGVITDMSANEETGDEEELVANNVEGVAVFANDITTGDFTFDQCPQNEARIGDPRWLVDVVVPMGEPIELYFDEGEDIGAKLAAAMETNKYPSKITINLLGGKNYQVVTPIQVNCPLEFSVWIEEILDPTHANEYANIDASALTGPMIQISDDIHPSLLKDNGFYDLGDIIIGNLKIKGLSQQLVYGNKVKALYGNVLLYHSIVEVAGGNKTVFDFNGGGVVEKLAISNSTIYGNPPHTGQLYSSQSGQKATEAGLEKQTISITNSTLYNIAYSKNVNTHRQANQTWLAYELKNSIIIDCGKQGQFVKGLNGGQSGTNPTWMIDGNSFQWTVDGALTDISANEETADEAEPVTNNVEGVVVFSNDITTGDFTLGECPQKTAKIGDPRWLNGPTVGIENVNAGANNDVWYNLQGVRVVSPAKGVYIKNGKKVVVK